MVGILLGATIATCSLLSGKTKKSVKWSKEIWEETVSMRSPLHRERQKERERGFVNGPNFLSLTLHLEHHLTFLSSLGHLRTSMFFCGCSPLTVPSVVGRYWISPQCLYFCLEAGILSSPWEVGGATSYQLHPAPLNLFKPAWHLTHNAGKIRA